MQRYAAFLRNVNTKQRNQYLINSTDLHNTLSNGDWPDVYSHKRNGNLILSSPDDRATLSEKLQNHIERHFYYRVDTFCYTLEELQSFLQDNPYTELAQKSKVYLYFLQEPPTDPDWYKLNHHLAHSERFTIHDKGTILYLEARKGMKGSRFVDRLETNLGVRATGRTYTLVEQMCQLLTHPPLRYEQE